MENNNYTELWRIWVGVTTKKYKFSEKSKRKLLGVRFDDKGLIIKNRAEEFLMKHCPNLFKQFVEEFPILDVKAGRRKK